MKSKYNTKQRYNSIQGLRSFKDTLPTKVKKIITKKGDVYSKTLDNWKYLVGEHLFKFCYPKYYKNLHQKGRCLTIMVRRGYEVELEYSRNLIIDKINYYFGYNVVESISIKTFDKSLSKNEVKNNTSVTKNNYVKKISNVKNNKIKNSLLELNKFFRIK